MTEKIAPIAANMGVDIRSIKYYHEMKQVYIQVRCWIFGVEPL